jgi:hypothetical protein
VKENPMRNGQITSYDDTQFRYDAEAQVMEAAQDLVDEFLMFIKETNLGSDIVDEVELPVRKPILIEAFKMVIAAEKRPQVRSLLVKAGVMLAQYRADLGPRIRLTPVKASDSDETEYSPQSELRLEKVMLLALGERHSLTATYQEAFARSFH